MAVSTLVSQSAHLPDELLQLAPSDRGYQAYLQGRERRLLYNVGPLLSIGLVFAATWQPGVSGPTASTLLVPLLGGAIVWATCIWPMLFLHSKQLKSPMNRVLPATTWLALARQTFTHPFTARLIVWHGAWALILAAVYCKGVQVRYGQEQGLSLFAPTRRFPSHLNERWIFLVGCNVSFAVCYALASAFKGYASQSKMTISKEDRWVRIRAAALEAWQRKAVFVGAHAVAYTAVYATVRTTAWAFLLRSSWGLLLPFMRNFARPSNLSVITLGSLCFTALRLHIFTLLLLRLPLILADVQATQQLDFAPIAKRGGSTEDKFILDALASESDFFLQFTMQEVADLSFQAGRRERIFADISGNPTLWNRLWRGLMLQLGRSYQNLQTQGGRYATNAAATAAPPPAINPSEIQVRENPNVYKASYLPPKPSTAQRTEQAAARWDQMLVASVYGAWTQLSSKTGQAAWAVWQKALPTVEAQVQSRPAVKAIEERAVQAKNNAVARVEQVKDMAQNPSAVAAQLGESSKSVVTVPKGIWTAYLEPAAKVVQDAADDVLAERWARDEVELVMSRRKMDVHGIRALAAFVTASYTEDTYGQVQQVIPATLEALTKYHTAIATFELDFRAQADARGGVWKEAAGKVWAREVEPVRSTIEQSIRWIEQTFGDSMRAFTFPASVARVLKSVTTASAA